MNDIFRCLYYRMCREDYRFIKRENEIYVIRENYLWRLYRYGHKSLSIPKYMESCNRFMLEYLI